jgi:hypothetical protein
MAGNIGATNVATTGPYNGVRDRQRSVALTLGDRYFKNPSVVVAEQAREANRYLQSRMLAA